MAHGRNEYVQHESGAEYFVEAYTTPPQLVVCGGGHVSKAIAPLAKPLGFRLFITDDREEFANPERFPEADILMPLKPEEALPKPAYQRQHLHRRRHARATATTTSPSRPLPALPAKYVGLMGSRRKTILIYEDLLRNGVPLDRVREIRSPVGLDVRARTPEEIAVSIMAEVLMFRLGGTGVPMKLEDWRLDRIVQKVEADKSAVPAD